jgi:hypothetical protein
MSEITRESTDLKIVEIERIIQDFKDKFKTGTTNADDFITITELELLWSELQNKTNKIYSDMVQEMMREVNESGLIRKKKENTAQKA